MKWWTLAAFFASLTASAASAVLTLDQYLDSVKSGNPDARSTISLISSYGLRLDEGEIPLMPEFYGQYNLVDDQKPTDMPSFQGTEKRIQEWKLGFRKQTSFGLGADLYFDAQRINLVGAQFPPPSPGAAPPATDYMASTATLSLKQSLWRNGFGEFTRADIAMKRAQNEGGLLQAKFKLKTILLNARNLYWSVVTYNQIVKLQQENVDRARKLRDYMNQRSKMRLYEDTDAMQAEAAFQTRELELQTSLDDRSVMTRKFNTLRGAESDSVPNLDGLPTGEMMLEAAKTPSGKLSREDFEVLRAQAKAGLAQASGAQSMIQPQLDLQGSIATNGRDGLTSESYAQATSNHYPTWAVGVTLSVPLDFGLLRDLRRGYRAAKTSAEDLDAQAIFAQAREWDDLVKQKKEAQGRFERAQNVEKIQTELVKRERQRLLAGRATTFEALNFEQNLALAQIQRVRAQLALMQIHNSIKTFEAKP